MNDKASFSGMHETLATFQIGSILAMYITDKTYKKMNL